MESDEYDFYREEHNRAYYDFIERKARSDIRNEIRKDVVIAIIFSAIYGALITAIILL